MDENECSKRIIGAAIEGHRELGIGLLESAYQRALAYELRDQGLQVESEVQVSMRYKSIELPDAFRMDLVVEQLVVVEVKAVQTLIPLHHAQLLTYLRGCGMKLGMLLNFHEHVLRKGIVRIVNQLEFSLRACGFSFANFALEALDDVEETTWLI